MSFRRRILRCQWRGSFSRSWVPQPVVAHMDLGDTCWRAAVTPLTETRISRVTSSGCAGRATRWFSELSQSICSACPVELKIETSLGLPDCALPPCSCLVAAVFYEIGDGPSVSWDGLRGVMLH
eukprot:s498_g29.t1